MAIDYTKIQLSSGASSNKVFLQGTGSFVVPLLPGIGDTFGLATIAHPYGSDGLIYQVSVFGVGVATTVVPWQSNDGRRQAYASVDSTNLYIACISSDASGAGNPAFTVQYTYRLLIP